MAQDLEVIEALASLTKNPEVATLVGDPKLTDDQLCDLIAELCGNNLPKEVANMLRVVIENGRLEAFPEIARQFRELKNSSEGIADAYIESAFELSAAELDSLLESLAKKLPRPQTPPDRFHQSRTDRRRLHSCRRQTSDGSIRARLAQMKTTLTA